MPRAYSAYGYPILFLGVLLEGAGIPVPGETAVLAAAFLASPAGGGHFDLILVIVTAALAAMLGDNLGYELGRRLARPRPGCRQRLPVPDAAQFAARAEGYFQRYGIWTVFFGRFVAALRSGSGAGSRNCGNALAALFLANAAGAVAWSVAISLLGYFFGYSFDKLHHWIGRASLALLACAVLFIGIRYLLHHLPKDAVEATGITRADLIRAGMVVALELACVALLVVFFRGHRQTPIDRELAEWIADHPSGVMDAIAQAALWIGSFPAVAAAAVLLAFGFWYGKYPIREIMAPFLVLIAAEAVGWLMIELFRHGPGHREEWSLGIAGLAPLRAVAVLGLIGNRLQRHRIVHRARSLLAIALILLICLGVIWIRAQTPTETLLECAAGGLVCFGAIRWVERDAALSRCCPAPERGILHLELTTSRDR